MRCSTSQVKSSVRLAPLAWALAAAACSNGNDVAVVSSAEGAAATLDRYCSECHNAAEFAGDFSVTSLDPAAVHENPELWERVVRKLRTRTMPPQDASGGPSRDVRTARDAGSKPSSIEGRRAEPRRSALRRLNRAEYANAIRDLLDLEVDVASLLPPDDAAYGFDNNADLLVVSPALLERYLSAADRVSALAVGDPATGDRREDLYRSRRPVAGDCISTACRSAPSAASPCSTIFRSTPSTSSRSGCFAPTSTPSAGSSTSTSSRSPSTACACCSWASAASTSPSTAPDTIITERSDATDARLTVRAPGRGRRAHRHGRVHPQARRRHESPAAVRPQQRRHLRLDGAPARRDVDDHGAVRADGRRRRRRAGGASSGCTPAEREAERATRVRARDPVAISRGARIAGPSATRISSGCCRSTATAARRARSTPASSSRCAACSRAPRSCFASSKIPPTRRREPRSRSATSSSPSRLSFFLWSSTARRRVARARRARTGCTNPACSTEQVRRMLPIRAPRRSSRISRASGCTCAISRTIKPNTDLFPDFDNNLRQAFKRETELFFASIVERGPQRPRPADGRLHVRRRAPRAALRHPERLRQPLPARAARRPSSTRAAGCSARAAC